MTGATGVTGVNAATDLAEFDAILAEFDKQGAIEDYMMFVNRHISRTCKQYRVACIVLITVFTRV